MIGGNHQQLCKKSSTFAPDLKKERKFYEGSSKSSVSTLTQLDEAEAPKNESFMKKTLLFMTIMATSIVAFSSCNVTRTFTNESQYYQKGDTSVVIQTKTIETYDASKKMY